VLAFPLGKAKNFYYCSRNVHTDRGKI
jgi:hypothetical protein